jgi:hypothetical protein
MVLPPQHLSRSSDLFETSNLAGRSIMGLSSNEHVSMVGIPEKLAAHTLSAARHI